MQAKLFVIFAILVTVSFHTVSVSAQESFNSWYQVDVILFKPRSIDLDEESWPDHEATFPADVISVYEGDIFSLSQLEQLESLTTDEAIHIEPEQQAPEFAFESLSNRQRNRRVVERVTGVANNESPLPQVIEVEAEVLPEPSRSVEDILEEAMSARRTNSPGALAFANRDEDSSLLSILRSLRRSSRFTVLDHQSWIQPIENEPTSVLIQAGKRFDDRFEVEGTLSVSRSRFLHVQPDLWFTMFEARGAGANPYVTGFQSSLSDEVLESRKELVEVERERGQYYPARTHHMFQSRRMRSDELHYIDHPLFGMVVRINRFRPDESGAE